MGFNAMGTYELGDPATVCEEVVVFVGRRYYALDEFLAGSKGRKDLDTGSAMSRTFDSRLD